MVILNDKMVENWIKKEWEKSKEEVKDPKKALDRLQELYDKGDLEGAKAYLNQCKFDKNNYSEKERKRIGEIYYWKELIDNNLLKVNKSKEKPEIFLPGANRKISNFSKELGNVLSKKRILFFRGDLMEISEIGKIKRPDGEVIEKGFISVSDNPSRFVSLVENYINPVRWIKVGSEWKKVEKSMSSSNAKEVLNSPQFQNNMPIIDRIFKSPFPIIYNGELTFPKKGYDPRFFSWLPFDSPDIELTDMSLEKAKKIIFYIYKEFVFQDKKDFTNAVANLLTPFIRGLFSSFSTRTPVFIFMANRERAGKDYCASIPGIVFEGQAIEEPPISSGEKNNNSNEELRKKLLSAFKQGRKRFHSANNKGLINNAIFESVVTSTTYSDRELGKNKIISFDNEMDFSLSGNIGMKLTPDLANRSKFINLFLDIEDANKRNFENPNLHHWIYSNRRKVLSALYSLVRNWFEKGKPKGTLPFASFPEWAEICGGIMEAAGFDNPCEGSEKGFVLSLDSETEEMKKLFELMYDKKPEEWIKKKDIINTIVNDSDDDMFSYINWDSKSDQTKFGIKLDKFIGRFLSNIRLTVKDSSVRASRREYKFTKESAEKDKTKIFGDEFQELMNEKDNKSSYNPKNNQKSGNLGSFGNHPPVTCENRILKNKREGGTGDQGYQGYQLKYKIIKDISKFALPQEIKEQIDSGELIYNSEYDDLFKTLEKEGYIIQLGKKTQNAQQN